MPNYREAFIDVAGLRTHYLEAGRGPDLVLLHSGEFGACAELSWERNIEELSEYFHVLAPDLVGYGQTEKVFSFESMRRKREDHITQFLRLTGVETAHFIGNSYGGTLLIDIASRTSPQWPMDRIVVVGGGGDIVENEGRAVLNGYDGTREHMRKIIATLFVRPDVVDDPAYLERRFNLSLLPGAWECAAATRFRAPHRTVEPPRTRDYSGVRVPVILVTGDRDALRPPHFGEALQKLIPGAELCVFPDSGHCPHIEYPDLFNALAIDFLRAPGGTRSLPH